MGSKHVAAVRTDYHRKMTMFPTRIMTVFYIHTVPRGIHIHLYRTIAVFLLTCITATVYFQAIYQCLYSH